MAQRDDCYEFNAPRHFHDFTKGDVEVDESYFDTVSETPKKVPAAPPFKAVGVPEALCPASPKAVGVPEASQSSPKAVGVPEASQSSLEAPVVPEASQSSLEAPVVPEAMSPAPPVSVRRKFPRRVSQAMSGLDTVGVRQSPRLAAIAKVLRRDRAARKSSGRPRGGTQASQRTRTRKRVVRRLSGAGGLTQQDQADLHTIAHVTHKTSGSTASTKPLTLTKPEEFHFATDSRLRGASGGDIAAVHPHSHPPPPPPPPAPHAGPTKPQEFHFATGARIKDKEPAQGEEQQCVDFTKSLRSSTTSLNKEAPVSRTVPQPFNLTAPRRKNAEEPSKFVSVAELNLKFHTKTPQRFRTKRAGGEIHDDAKRVKTNPLGLTMPHTPQLVTRNRSRPVNCLSQQQMEAKALAEAQRQTFKARPVNKKVLEPPSLDTVVEKKLPTVPEPFNITDTKRAEAASVRKTEEECGAADESSLSVASLGHGTKRPATKVKPFSFDSRDKAKQQQKQDKIKKYIAEEKSLAEFHAQPMPAFDNGVVGVPAKKPPTPTQLQPFALQADQRGMVKQLKFKAQLKKESHLEAEQRKFQAQSGQVVHKAPFVPGKSQRPLTEISSFALNTEVRAGQRCQYDLKRKMHEEEILMAKKQEEERQAAREAEEVARLRQEAVHKANPAPKFKPVPLHLPQQPVTIPKSPKFATESRLRSRPQVNSTFDVASTTFTAE